MSKIYSARMPMVSREFANEIKRRFPRIDVKVTTTIEEVQRSEGAQEVVDFIMANANQEFASSDIADTVEAIVSERSNESRLSRLFNNIKFKVLTSSLLILTTLSFIKG